MKQLFLALFALNIIVITPAWSRCYYQASPDALGLFEILSAPNPDSLNLVKKYLSTHNVLVSEMNEKCESPLLASLATKKYDTFYFLYSYYNNPDVNSYYISDDDVHVICSIYDYGLTFGDWNLISFLKNFGGDIKKAGRFTSGMTDLMFVSWMNKNVETTKAIIQAGVDVNEANSQGWTALMYAAADNNLDVIKTLLQAGADINHTDSDGGTALLHAADYQKVEVINTLIQAGADVNHADYGGMSALSNVALANDNVNVVPALILAGAKVNHANYYGQTPLDFARMRTNPDMAREIRRAGGRRGFRKGKKHFF